MRFAFASVSLGLTLTAPSVHAAEPAPTGEVRVIEPRGAPPTPGADAPVDASAGEADEPPGAAAPPPAIRAVAPAPPSPREAPARPADASKAAELGASGTEQNSADPREDPRASPPFFRFGVAGIAGTTGFDGGAARIGLDAHFGAQLTPSFALFGGFLVGITVEPRTARTEQIFYAQFEGDYDDLIYASAGPAAGLVPRSSTNLEDFTFAAGFLARAGVLVGRRNESGRKNAFLVGVAFVGLLGDEFYSFPMVALGYERF